MIAAQYLLHLKTLKPDVNVDQTDSDWYVRAQVLGGVFSGIYADQLNISNDPFPQSARHEALEKLLNMWFGSGFIQPTVSNGFVNVSAASGSSITAGIQFTYEPNGNIYAVDQTFDFGSATTGTVHVVSVATGASQNLLAGAQLTLTSPPAGVNSTGTVAVGNIADGRDMETDPEAATRILLRLRTPLAGGKVSDYQSFALAADPSVVSATILRFPFGFGTVGVVITAGTTDIDDAINNGEPVIQTPSQQLLDSVTAYINNLKPITDCVSVFGAQALPINVSVNVNFTTGDASTIPAGQTLTQGELVQREVQRALYKMPPGGRVISASGFVLASEIEDVLDAGLGNTVYNQGIYAQILSDRQVLALSATGENLGILAIQQPNPGTISVTEFI